MKKLNALFVLLTATAVIGCQQTATTEAGQYQGTLPCADCAGIKTQLSLHADKSFVLTSEYLGKQNAIFSENGTYSIAHQLITLNIPTSGEKIYYKITRQGLALSDEQGNIHNGEYATDYILQKQ